MSGIVLLAVSSLDLMTMVLLASIVVGVTAAILAWHERPDPGAASLTALLAGQIWWSVFLVFDLHASTLAGKVFWADIRWIGVVVIPVAWVLFAFDYTGRDRFLKPRYVVMASVVPAITVVLALTGQHHQLLYVDSQLVEQGGRSMLSRTPGPWFWVIAAYTYALGVIGAIPLLGLVRSDAIPFRGQSVALLVGIFAPWAINVAFLADWIPIPGFDPTPVGFAISGVAYLAAIKRFRLFGTSPSPNRKARRLVFERMHEGAVVVDNHDYVVDMNQTAARLLDRAPREVLGRPGADVIPAFDRLPDEGPAPDHITVTTDEGTQFYDVAVTLITDANGRTLGRVLTFHDVGEHLRQQQRLEVLNRVLRHNIRNETNLITGYADLMGDDDGMDMMIKQSAHRVEEMGEKARVIGELFEDDAGGEAVSLGTVLDDAIETARERYPAVAIDRQPLPEGVSVSAVLREVVENVVVNAAEHNTNDDPHVRVRVELDANRVRVIVADNGPGISDYERDVLEHGTETPLQHGSGLGLWLIKWGVEIAGGQLRIDDREPTGSIVTLDVPVVDRPATGGSISAASAPGSTD